MKKTYHFAIAALFLGLSTVPSVIKANVGPQMVNPTPVPAPVTISMKITAYSSTADQTDSTPFITASGMHVRDGIVATNMLPFGTKIEMPALFGDKVFVVEDRMNARIKNTIDIWMPTRADALTFGVNHTDVVIVSDSQLSEK